jgi:amino acid transporter
VVPLPPPPHATEAVTYWLLLKVFASGCTALTGVEAVSNGVKAFREPTVKNAQRTLTVIIFLLAVLLAGISYLVKTYGIAATDPGAPGYQSVLSMLTSAVFGKGAFLLPHHRLDSWSFSLYPPTPPSPISRASAAPSRRTIICRMSSVTAAGDSSTPTASSFWPLCGGVLILFGGVTDRLIPLYAVGAFMAFTLSQAGMVMHWRKNRGPNWLKSAFVNGLGAFVTGTTTIVVLVAKFVEGAWITLLFIPLTIVFFSLVRRHYHAVKLLTSCKDPGRCGRSESASDHRHCHRPVEQHHPPGN